MNNHIHLIAIPEQLDSLSIALRHTHGRYALYVNTRRQHTGHLWQSRFFSCALDDQHLATALRYVERNPVRANLVKAAQDYLWSSARSHLNNVHTPEFLDWPFYLQMGGSARWATLLAEPDNLLTLRALQRHTLTGRHFVATLPLASNRD